MRRGLSLGETKDDIRGKTLLRLFITNRARETSKMASQERVRSPTGAPMRYHDRVDAGRILADRLKRYAGRDDVTVLGLPRGGVPVAAEVARALGAPLDVFLVRKLGLPGQEELAMGAIASGGARVLNADVVRSLGVPDRLLDEVAARELVELERRESDF